MIELFTYDFMQRSLLAAAMVGGLCSVVGVFVVLRGLAFVGAGTAHAAFAGVALGYLMGWPCWCWRFFLVLQRSGSRVGLKKKAG